MRARFDGICSKCGKRIVGFQTSPYETTSDIGWRRRGDTYGLQSVAWHTGCALYNKFDNMQVISILKRFSSTELLSMLKKQSKASVLELDLTNATSSPSTPVSIANPDVPPVNPITINIPDADAAPTMPDADAIPDAVNDTLTNMPIDYLNQRIPGQHHNFSDLVFNAANGIHSFLYGEAGSGKSYSAKVLAQMLGLPYYFIAFTPQTPVTTFSGYMDGYGKYVSTNVRHWVDNGGVLCMDECDNAFNPALIWFNNGLASGEFNFPDSAMPVKMHESCIVVAAANTPGLGPTKQYMDRRPIDESVRSRFAFIEWNTDAELEMHIAMQSNPIDTDSKQHVANLINQVKENKAKNQDKNVKVWVEFVQKTRNYCKENIPNLIITQRTTILGAQMIRAGQVNPDKLIDSLMVRGADKMTREKLIGNVGTPKFR